MQHLALKATTTATDQELGTFRALVSAWDADRERDVITRDAFDATIKAWRESGKYLPLLFEHSATVVGSIDPDSMKPTEEGLEVAGEVDRSTDAGQQVWRTIKSGTAGFSIGYVSKDRRRKGGGRELYEIDLLEISATSKPMHPATRALSWKSADGSEPLDDSDLDAMTDAELRAYTTALIGDIDTKAHQPIRIATFEC
jgi:HK97 family phage prohead protease